MDENQIRLAPTYLKTTITDSVSGSTTYTKSISLSSANFKSGMFFLHSQSGASGSPGVFFMARKSSGAVGSSAEFNLGYTGLWTKAVTTNISNNIFSSSGTIFSLQSALINGSNLDLVFVNSSGSTQSLGCELNGWLWS